jgi:hypothetical protein
VEQIVTLGPDAGVDELLEVVTIKIKLLPGVLVSDAVSSVEEVLFG